MDAPRLIPQGRREWNRERKWESEFFGVWVLKIVFSTWVLQYVLMVALSVYMCYSATSWTSWGFQLCIFMKPEHSFIFLTCSHCQRIFPVSFTACLFMQLYFHCGENKYSTSGMFYCPPSQPQAWCRWTEQHSESCACGGGRQMLTCKQIRASLRFPVCQGSFPVSTLQCYYCGLS